MTEQMNSPNRDTSCEKRIAPFGRILFGGFLDFFRANLILLAGVLPGILLTVWGIWSRFLPLVVIGGLTGGLAGGPLLCGLYSTIFRALREEPGFWSLAYKKALKQSGRDALAPGAVFGLLLGLWLYAAADLGRQGTISTGKLFALVEVLFFLLGLSHYVFYQVTMVHVSVRNLYFNSIRMFIGFLPRSLASAAVQTLYWAVFLLLLPRSVPALIITGFWLPCLLSVRIVLRPMESCLRSQP